jgi:FixJ family two-component response regulator
MIAGEEQPTVFIIDDDASVREGVGDLLRSVGLGVQSFGSTQDFLQSKRPNAPGCIVLDVRLPGPSGLEFQRTLTESSISLPVIFLTGHGDISMSVKAIKSGAIEFLTKPVREQALLDAVQAGIARDRVRREQHKLVAELRERFNSIDAARTGSHAIHRHRTPEQADCWSTRVERDDCEGPSRPNHAKDAREVSGRSGANGRQARDFPRKVLNDHSACA